MWQQQQTTQQQQKHNKDEEENHNSSNKVVKELRRKIVEARRNIPMSGEKVGDEDKEMETMNGSKDDYDDNMVEESLTGNANERRGGTKPDAR